MPWYKKPVTCRFVRNNHQTIHTKHLKHINSLFFQYTLVTNHSFLLKHYKVIMRIKIPNNGHQCLFVVYIQAMLRARQVTEYRLF